MAREALFVTVARVARFYELGRGVLGLQVAEFFAWLDAMPELMRQEELTAVRLRVLAGQRGVSDESYEKILRDLERPVRRGERVSEADRLALEDKVNRLNEMCQDI